MKALPCLWPEHQGLAGHGTLPIRSCSRSARNPRPGHDDRRTHPVWRNVVVPSNPLGLAEFTLSRRDPEYVGRAKAVDKVERARLAGDCPAGVDPALKDVFAVLRAHFGDVSMKDVEIGSMIYCIKPGDGSAVSRQFFFVLPACAGGRGEHRGGICHQALPLQPHQLGHAALPAGRGHPVRLGDYILIPNIREALKGDLQNIPAYVLGGAVKPFTLYMAPLTADERQILADGCLINFYKH